MTFSEFLRAHRGNTLDSDAAWRAYDIQSAVRPQHARKALKKLGLAYAGELALPEFCARYDVAAGEAEAILGAYWLWSLIDSGRAFPRVPLRTAKAG